jgi:ABC-2 type transport system permease protein
MPPDLPALSRVAAVARHQAALLARSPGPLISYTVLPILLMTVIQPMLRLVHGGPPAQGTVQAAAGMAVMFSLFALKLVAANLLDERLWRTWDRLRASPARLIEVMAGKVAPMLCALLVQQGVLFLFAALVFGLRPAGGWLALVLAALAWCSCVLLLGSAAATLARSTAQLSAGGDIAAVLNTILGGALVPVALLPAWIRAASPISPGYWAMRGYEAAFTGHGLGPLAVPMLGLAAFAVLGATACAGLSRRWA